MDKIPVKIEYLPHYKGDKLNYANEGDAGFDFRAAIDRTRIIYTGMQVLIPLGVKMAIPEGYELQLRPRSGLAAKYGITLTNSPGTIDSGYRGEICAIINRANDGFEGSEFKIKEGDRICQGVLNKVPVAEFVEVDSLDETERGEGGFGSSGVV